MFLLATHSTYEVASTHLLNVYSMHVLLTHWQYYVYPVHDASLYLHQHGIYALVYLQTDPNI